jgi:RecA-family ATPase
MRQALRPLSTALDGGKKPGGKPLLFRHAIRGSAVMHEGEVIRLKDWNDAHILGLDAREQADMAWADHFDAAGPASATALNYDEFLRLVVPPREMLLEPWLPSKGLAMIYGLRGVGKTHVAVGVAWAVATGTAFLRWSAPRPMRVILIDGEMPVASLQERLTRAIDASSVRPPDATYLKIAASDHSPDGLPDLADPRSHQFYADLIGDSDLVIADNLSTLCPSVKENDADSWVPMQSWELDQRRRGKSVVLFHHGGKSGKQRGTSRKEDVLNTVIALRRPYASGRRGVLAQDRRTHRPLEIDRGAAAQGG